MFKVYRLHRRQMLAISPDVCWAFFSNPWNLPLLAPPGLDLQVQGGAPNRIYPGLLFSCRARPVGGIPIRWWCEITQVDDPVRFVDEQRSGPFRMWHHEHHFREADQGVLVEDIVHYAIGMGPLGRVLNKLYVRRSVEKMFDFRSQALERLFGQGSKHAT